MRKPLIRLVASLTAVFFVGAMAATAVERLPDPPTPIEPPPQVKNLFHVSGVLKAADTSVLVVTYIDNSGAQADYSFMINAKTRFYRRNNSRSHIGELTAGDAVKVWATSLTGGTAVRVWDKSIWWVSVKGKVSDLNATSGTFTLNVVRKTATITYPVVTSGGTKIATGRISKTFSDLSDGMTKVHVKGWWNDRTKQLQASRIGIPKTK